jgi:hypothetical protein
MADNESASQARRVAALARELEESRRELGVLQERDARREHDTTLLRARVAELTARDAERARQADVHENQRREREAELVSDAAAANSLQLQLLAGLPRPAPPPQNPLSPRLLSPSQNTAAAALAPVDLSSACL